MTQAQSSAQKILEHLTDLLQDYDQDLFDLDCDDMRLELSFANNRILLLNYHQTTEQLWMSSPISGAHHFVYQEGTWICMRSGRQLIALLSEELKLLTGETINLNVT